MQETSLDVSRRRFLTTAMAAGTATVAGCGGAGSRKTTSVRIEPVVDATPGGVALYPNGRVRDAVAMAELLSGVDSDQLEPTDDGGFLLRQGVTVRTDEEVRATTTGGYWIQLPEIEFTQPLRVEYQYVPESRPPCEMDSEHPAPVAPLIDEGANKNATSLFASTPTAEGAETQAPTAADLPTSKTFAERTYHTATRWADSGDMTESVPAHTLFYHEVYARVRELENLKYARLGLLHGISPQEGLSKDLSESWAAIREMNAGVLSFLSPTIGAVLELTDSDLSRGDIKASAGAGTNILAYLEDFDYLKSLRFGALNNVFGIVGAVNLVQKIREQGVALSNEAQEMVDEAVTGSVLKQFDGWGGPSIVEHAQRLAEPSDGKTVSQLVTFRGMDIQQAAKAFAERQEQYTQRLKTQQRDYYELLNSLKPTGSAFCLDGKDHGLVPRDHLYLKPDGEVPSPEYTGGTSFADEGGLPSALPERRTLFEDIIVNPIATDGESRAARFINAEKQQQLTALAGELQYLKTMWNSDCNIGAISDPSKIAKQALTVIYAASHIEHILSATEIQTSLHRAVSEGQIAPVTAKLRRVFGCSAKSEPESGAGQQERTTAEPEAVIDGPFDGWRTYQADSQNTGHIAGQSGPTRGLTRVWRFDEEAEQVAPLAVHGNTVYAGRDGMLIAINAESGTERWRYTPDVGVTATPTVKGDSVYVPVDGGVAALSVADGSEQWRVTDYDGPGVGGVVGSDHVYQTIGENRVVSLSVADGTERWSFQGKSDQLPELNAISGYADGTIFAGVKRNVIPYPLFIVALDANSGTPRWRTSLGDESGLSPVTVTDDHVIGVSSNQVAVLARSSGDVLWTDDMAGTSFQAPVVDDNTLYVNWTQTQQVRAYALDSGEERWRYEGFGSGNQMGDLAVVDGTVYVGANGRVTVLSAGDGAPLLEGETVLPDGQARSFVAPVVLGGALFVNTDAAVVALSD